MTIREILLVGVPELYEVSEEVLDSEIDTIPGIVQDLHDTMMEFRKKHGFGRAIAAPQIGVMKRIIYMNIDKPVVLVNPKLKDLSSDMIEIWDDCMSIPNLLIKVNRHRTCTIEYSDANWAIQSMELKDDLSELLQHEYDHLEGILAFSRAINNKSFEYRNQLY